MVGRARWRKEIGREQRRNAHLLSQTYRQLINNTMNPDDILHRKLIEFDSIHPGISIFTVLLIHILEGLPLPARPMRVNQEDWAAFLVAAEKGREGFPRSALGRSLPTSEARRQYAQTVMNRLEVAEVRAGQPEGG